MLIVSHQFVYDPHFRPKLSAWREGLASRQRRRARPHLRSLSSTPSDSEDEGQQPLQRGMLGKSNDLGRSEYTASSQIELRELIASEVESLRSSGEEADKASIRFRHKRNSHDRRVDNVCCLVSTSTFVLLITRIILHCHSLDTPSAQIQLPKLSSH